MSKILVNGCLILGLIMGVSTNGYANEKLCNHLKNVNGSAKTPNKTSCSKSVRALAGAYGQNWNTLSRCLSGAKNSGKIGKCFDDADRKVSGLTAAQLSKTVSAQPSAQRWCAKLQTLLKGAKGISAAQAKKLKKGCPQFYSWTQKRFGPQHASFFRCSMASRTLPQFDGCQQRVVLRMWALGS